MKPEDLVPLRATCEALREAGFPQDDCCFYRGKFGSISRVRTMVMSPSVAAPTLQEVLDCLFELGVDIAEIKDAITSDNPAEAAAQLWIRVNKEEVAP